MAKIPTLTKAQEELINCLKQSIWLQAPVGSGKTVSLALRAIQALRAGIDPGRILCLTFDNLAADEMREKIKTYSKDAEQVTVETVEGLCVLILRQGAKKLGISTDFDLADEDDSKQLIGALQLDRLVSLSIPRIYQLIHHHKLGKNDESVEEAILEDLVHRYQKGLQHLNWLDRADLLLQTRQALAPGGFLSRRWAECFDLVQVDEAQDLQVMEYEIIARLALKGQNLVLAVDPVQTIYEWRGSAPDQIRARFFTDFPEAREMTFPESHRFSGVLFSAIRGMAVSLGGTAPEADLREAGKPIEIHAAEDELSEALWIGERIQILRREGLAYDKIGVLCRSVKRAVLISQGLERAGIPHLGVDTPEFFHAREIKDLGAYLRFLLNPSDNLSFRRMLKRPAEIVSERALQEIEEMQEIGLALTDFGSAQALAGEPFAPLISRFDQGTVILFDCAATGSDPERDEIIEIAAWKVCQGHHKESFHKYIRPRRSVGASIHVHGLTDGFLQEQGESPRTVLTEFVEFAGDAVLLGYNSRAELLFLQRALEEHQIKAEPFRYCDILPAAKRFIPSAYYRLEYLVQELGFLNLAAPRVETNVAAIYGLLRYLLPFLKKQTQLRQEVIISFAPAFQDLAERISQWRGLMLQVRPADLIMVILKNSGLGAFYAREPRRIKNLEEFHLLAKERDNPNLLPVQALRSFLNFVALAGNPDRPGEGRVSCSTVFEAKGREFDVVFLAGLSAYEFPHYGALKAGREKEERRLFYVAVTRARKQLLISYYRSRAGRTRRGSDYLRYLPADLPAEG